MTHIPTRFSKESFEGLFGVDTPIVIDFHGYPAHVKALLFERNQSITRKRFEVLGYVCDELIRYVEVMMINLLPQIEEGTTTTPWSMLRLNQGDGLLSLSNVRQELFSLIPFLFSLAGRFDIIDKAISLISIANPNSPIGVKVMVLEFPQKHALMFYIVV